MARRNSPKHELGPNFGWEKNEIQKKSELGRNCEVMAVPTAINIIIDYNMAVMVSDCTGFILIHSICAPLC